MIIQKRNDSVRNIRKILNLLLFFRVSGFFLVNISFTAGILIKDIKKRVLQNRTLFKYFISCNYFFEVS